MEPAISSYAEETEAWQAECQKAGETKHTTEDGGETAPAPTYYIWGQRLISSSNTGETWAPIPLVTPATATA